MEGQVILVTGPEMGHDRYEASFLSVYFDEFKSRVQKTLEIFVSHDELEKLKECDYHTFCTRISTKIQSLLH